MSSQRYKLTLAYRGTRYYGWQFQTTSDTWKDAPLPGGELPTIQGTLAKALASVLCHDVNLVGSSRTDAGVHAKAQIAHLDTTMVQIPPDSLRRAVNHRLPEDILIRAIEPVPAEFNAILWTTSKRYQYHIWNAADRDPFNADLAFHRWQPMDVDRMRQAAKYLEGTHDFASFAKPGHGRESTVRTVFSCTVSARGPRVVIGVEGSGFLWNMVRIIAGTLIEVGIGRYAPGEIPAMLAAKHRRAAGQTAPAHGLYLQWIKSRPQAPVDV